MSSEVLFNWPSRRRKRAEARKGRHERQKVDRGASSRMVDQGVAEAWAQFETFGSPVSRGADIPIRVLVGARVLGASLDNKLAAGRGPETSDLLAARAQLIVSKPRRRKLAENWLALLDDARDSSVRRGTGVPLLRDRINGAESQIQALANALLAPLPTSRGVAMANSLLSDGTGPIYHRACSTDLVSTLREVIKRLDAVAA